MVCLRVARETLELIWQNVQWIHVEELKHCTGSNKRCSQLCKKYSTRFICLCILYLTVSDLQPDLPPCFQVANCHLREEDNTWCNGKGKYMRFFFFFFFFLEEGAWSFHSNFDNLVGYTCINVQFIEQTHKTVRTINISKINNVQLCSNVQNLSIYVRGLENYVHSCIICYRN